jgi:hypothetical protein
MQAFNRQRLWLALIIWFSCAVAAVLPLVWLINNHDWGIALMLIMPGVVYGLMRFGRRLEGWAKVPAR